MFVSVGLWRDCPDFSMGFRRSGLLKQDFWFWLEIGWFRKSLSAWGNPNWNLTYIYIYICIILYYI